MDLIVPGSDDVIEVNRIICEEGGNPFKVLDEGKVESALHTALIPYSEEYQNQNIPGIAGLLCFYLTKCHAFLDGNKRTGALVSLIFLEMNGFELKYKENTGTKNTEFAEIVLGIAFGKINKNTIVEWFEIHSAR